MNKRLKRFLLVLLLLAVLCPVVLIGLETVRNSRRTSRLVNAYETGVEQLKRNQLDKAKKAFIECLSYDEHNQDAIVYLAEIAERQKNYPQAIHLWKRAGELQANNMQYKKRVVENTLLLRDFVNATTLLNALPESERNTPEYELKRIFCEMAQGSTLHAKGSLRDFQKAFPDYRSELLTYMEISMDVPQKRTFEEGCQAFLTLLENSTSPAVQYETLLTLAAAQKRMARQSTSDAARAAHINETIRLLTRAAEVNPACGHAALAEFLFQCNRDQECVQAYEQAVPYGLSLTDAVFFADALMRLGKIDELRGFAKHFTHGSRPILQVGYYLESLLAYDAHDFKTMTEKLEHTGDFSRLTASGLMLNVCAAIHAEDFGALLQLVLEIRQQTQWQRMLPTVRELCQGLLQKAYMEHRFTEAAPLATTLSEAAPDKPDRLLLGLRLHAAGLTNAACEPLFQEILHLDPNDLEALETGARFYLLNGRPDLCVTYAERALAFPVEDAVGLNAVRCAALEMLDRPDEVATHWQELQRSPQGNFISAEHWLLFCLRYMKSNPAYMSTFLGTVAGAQGPEKNLLPIPSLVAMKGAPHEELRAKALPIIETLLKAELFDTTRTPDAQVLFELALLLGMCDETQKSIDLFLSIRDAYPVPVLISMNLSEQYAIQGKKEYAMKAALEAYTANPDQPEVVFCYAKRLHEQGRWSHLRQLMEPWLGHAVHGEQARLLYEEAMRAGSAKKPAEEEGKAEKDASTDAPSSESKESAD